MGRRLLLAFVAYHLLQLRRARCIRLSARARVRKRRHRPRAAVGAAVYVVAALLIGLHLFHGYGRRAQPRLRPDTAASAGVRPRRSVDGDPRRVRARAGRVIAGWLRYADPRRASGRSGHAGIAAGPSSSSSARRSDVAIRSSSSGRACRRVGGGTLSELGYRVRCLSFHDSPRREHSVAAQGGINAAKDYRNDGDSVERLFQTRSRAETSLARVEV